MISHTRTFFPIFYAPLVFHVYIFHSFRRPIVRCMVTLWRTCKQVGLSSFLNFNQCSRIASYGWLDEKPAYPVSNALAVTFAALWRHNVDLLLLLLLLFEYSPYSAALKLPKSDERTTQRFGHCPRGWLTDVIFWRALCRRCQWKMSIRISRRNSSSDHVIHVPYHLRTGPFIVRYVVRTEVLDENVPAVHPRHTEALNWIQSIKTSRLLWMHSGTLSLTQQSVVWVFPENFCVRNPKNLSLKIRTFWHHLQ